ncbi:MAG: beta-galactosidase, partial [Planctomycetota bacterium]
MNLKTSLLAAALWLVLGQLGAAEILWIEGEAAKSNDFVRHSWYDAVAKESFSGKEWLSHYDKNKPGTAKWEFEAKEGGECVFWLRCNYFACEMDFQLNGPDWKPIDCSLKNVREGMQISAKPDHRFIGWVKVGKVALNKGPNTLAITIHSKLCNHGGIDCFCFAPAGFVPTGASKPMSEPAESKPDSWFPVNADVDVFSSKSITDMSGLLHTPAGKLGFLARAGARLKFEKGDGPVKFWGVCASVEEKDSPADMALRCRYFAKHGINMVRQHPVFGFLGPLKDGQFDARKIDTWDRWCAELKKQGIYMTWSVFYPLRISAADGYPPELLAELEKGGDGLYSTMGLVNISRQLQDLELKYVKALLNHVNPYTELAYKDEPALAVLEIHNEDCVFFHNPLTGLAANKPPKHAKLLRQMFCEWAQEKYGTDEALQKAWGTRESLAAGELRLYGTWQMAPQRPQVDSKARLGDQIHFLTEIQRDYYTRRMKELRTQCGYKAVTVTTAWWTEAIASPANLYCDTVGDMIDRHNYFGGGEGAHAIRAGKVNNGTHLAQPGSGILSSGFFQVEDQPFCMTEWTASPPNQWKAEMAPLFAFYGMGLQGWDASYHFAATGPRLGDGWPGLSWYCTDTPHYIGQFPALAFALYKGHIQEAPLAAARRLKLADLFSGEDALKQGGTATGGTGADAKTATGTQTPNEALAIGRVTVSFEGRAPEGVDLSKYWDKEKKLVRSLTGELVWNYERRVVTLNTPKTQAIIGFAGGEAYDLSGVRVRLASPFASL